MLPESVAGNPPRSIVTDHYLLDHCTNTADETVQWIWDQNQYRASGHFWTIFQVAMYYLHGPVRLQTERPAYQPLVLIPGPITAQRILDKPEREEDLGSVNAPPPLEHRDSGVGWSTERNYDKKN